MKKLFYLFIAAVMLFPMIASAENEVPADIRARLKHDMLLRSSSQGTKFIVTLPPNEKPAYNYADVACEMYVSAQSPTIVDVYYGANKSKTKQYTINQSMGVVNIQLPYKVFEIREDDTVSGERTIIVESQNPVSVYVINSKSATSDGYMAIPVSAWGKEYIHCAYYDNKESSDFASGFIVMAAEDNTTATITARGVGANYDTTSKGRKIGDVWDIKLNAGEYYKIQGAANTDGLFDLTGTSIKADKPIGVISFHERTGLPWAIDNSRNCLSEMVMPLTAWGTKYASVNFDRGAGDKGDIYRVVSAEPNTNVKVRWYDKTTLALKDSLSRTLKNAGDFFEYLDAPGIVAQTSFESINGPAVFEADKPIMVMQYSPEESWDNATDGLDPFMVVVPSVDQYTMATVFQVPSNKNFFINNVNLIVRGDTSDAIMNDSLLKSVVIDGKPVYTIYPKLLTNRIPGTDLYFVQGLEVALGAHYITAETKFGGVLYGKKSVDSYGWPLSMSINYDGQIDTIAPVAQIVEGKGVYKIKVTDLEAANPAPNSKQKQSGVTEYPVLLSGSSNCSISGASANFTVWPPNYNTEFDLTIDEKAKDAKAVFMVTDIKGNYKLDSINYIAKVLNVSENKINFGNVRVNTSSDKNFSITNITKPVIKIDSIYLTSGKKFSINANFKDTDISSNQAINGLVTYHPTYPENYVDVIEYDTLVVVTDAIVDKIYLEGFAVYSGIEITDFIVDNVVVGAIKCNSEAEFANAIVITNTGSADLTVFGYDVENAKAAFMVNSDITFPYTIKSAGSMQINKVCFAPIVGGCSETNVVFHTDAVLGDSVSLWQGNCHTSDINEPTSNGFELKFISPNPVNDNQFVISFNLGDNSNTTKIEMLNMNGEVVKLISNELINAGEHSLNVSTNDLPSGTYLVKITSGAYVASQKVVIVK